jgi:protein phosphatase
MFYYAKSTQGLKSRTNEDYYLLPDKDTNRLPVFLLCDGMGGHPAGNIASRLCIEIFHELYLADSKNSLENITREVNRQIIEYSTSHPECYRMGTTLCALKVDDEIASIVSVGDSRVYLFTPADFEQLTEDQSPVWELFSQGLISKDDITTHPRNNIIKEAIGLKEIVTINSYKITYPSERWVFLICSDGLTDVTVDAEIHDVMKGITTLKEGVDKLTRLAIQNKSRDDITVVLVSSYIPSE